MTSDIPPPGASFKRYATITAPLPAATVFPNPTACPLSQLVTVGTGQVDAGTNVDAMATVLCLPSPPWAQLALPEEPQSPMASLAKPRVVVSEMVIPVEVKPDKKSMFVPMLVVVAPVVTSNLALAVFA